MLRLDDTDTERSTLTFARGIEEDLKWLGIEWDDSVRQSDRLELYEGAVECLRKSGRLYPCYETRDELEIKRNIIRSRGLQPIYDRGELKLTAAELADFANEGRVPHWRFKLEDTAIEWEDLVRSRVKFEAKVISDPVLIREDGRPLYSLSSVVDDGELNISHVIRGEDHVVNTAVQIQLFDALGYGLPSFGHLPLLVDKHGQNFSKRLESKSLRGLREGGIEASAISSYLSNLGTPQTADGSEDYSVLAGRFDIGVFGRASPRLDMGELERHNSRVLHHLSFNTVSERLKALKLEEVDEDFWIVVRPNLTRLSEVEKWWRVCHDVITPVIEDSQFCETAASLLPIEPWNESTWACWTKVVSETTGRKGRKLYHPLRLALTGLDNGPELKCLLRILGRARAITRLNGSPA